MDNLTSYISNKRSKYKAGSTQGYIDGHIHLFDKYEFLGNLYAINKMCVGFGDFVLKVKSKSPMLFSIIKRNK